MQTIITEAILTGLATILVAFIGYLSQKVAVYLKEKGIAEQLESKGYLVDIAVQAVEQIYENRDGATKFEFAKQEAIKLLKNNGFEVSDVELNNFIESSVRAMKEGFSGVIVEDMPQPDIDVVVEDVEEEDVAPEVAEDSTIQESRTVQKEEK